MDIQTVSGAKGIPLTHIVKARYSPGKVALPVRKSQYLYSNLKHVTGVPAARKEAGYSLMKLQALDNLIERLGEYGKKSFASLNRPEKDSTAISQMIDRYAGELHNLVIDERPYHKAPVEQGLLVNVTV